MSLIRNFALHLIIIQDNHFLKSSRLTAAIFVLLYNFGSPLMQNSPDHSDHPDHSNTHSPDHSDPQITLIRNFALHLIIIQDNHFLKSSRLTAAIFCYIQ